MVRVLVVVFIATFLSINGLFAHCQIPCGIYGDQMRFDMIEEDITTVEKSMNQIMELQKQTPVNYNQLVRWINNKELHAQKIQDVVNEYFLTQRIKPTDPSDKNAYEDYTRKLAFLHQLMFYAMKAKQTTDLKHIGKLRSLLGSFHSVYFGPEEKKHMDEHRPK